MGRKSVARSFKHSFDKRSIDRTHYPTHTTRMLNRARNNYSSIFFSNELSIEDPWKLFIPNEFWR